MKALLIIVIIYCYFNASSQVTKNSKSEKLLKEISENACKCIDSVSTYNKSKEEISKEISRCIDEQTGAYQLGTQLLSLDNAEKTKAKNDTVKIDVSINEDKNSQEYKSFYYEIERYLVDNCKSIVQKIKTADKQNEKSFSNDKESLNEYHKGVDEMTKGNYKNAISYYKKAVTIDPNFAFAWDNIGICYRKLDDYDEAINAYKKSLEIDPNGLMPLQNIAIAYTYKKQYDEAIAAYNKLSEIDNKNPEVYYGIGQIYVAKLNNYEAGLEYMCKAYNLYVEQKSPYRTDAEKIIQFIYSEMKKQGNEKRFQEILESNHIKSN